MEQAFIFRAVKLLYYLHLNYSRDSGVYRKICEQLKCWSTAGHDVRLVLISSTLHDRAAMESDVPGVKMTVVPYESGTKIRSLASRLSALRCASRFVEMEDPDIVYMRQDLHYPGASSFLRRVKTVVEINTDDLAEYAALSLIRYRWHSLTRRIVLDHLAGAVFVTDELRKKLHYQYVGGLSTVIPNGYPLAEATRIGSSDTAEITRVVFIGSPGMPWHGVDKLRVLAEACPSWEFDIIGVEAGEINNPIPLNFHFHGMLSKSRYEPFLQRATVGIGTLALHRKGMNEACALKTREYLAYGLPVIIGYQDTDFKVAPEYVCQLPNSEENVSGNIERIVTFVKKWKGRRVDRDCILHLDTASKESERLRFFDRILNRG